MTPELVREQVREGRRGRHLATVDDYLAALRHELAGADPALVQDALASAHEYLRGEQGEAAAAGRELDEAQLVARTLERYGTPQEVAEAYRDNERRRLQPGPFPAPPAPERSVAQVVFGVLVEPRAYTSVFYMFLALGTGIVYFTWAITGLALSIGLMPLVVGIPFALLYLASLRLLAQLEGRIVEGLLGERMPRLPPPASAATLGARIKRWVTDARTWTTLAYMLVQLPLGIVYFTLSAILFSLTLGLALAPFAHLFSGLPLLNFGTWGLHLPWYLSFPLLSLAAAFDLLVGLHLARGIGRLHARYAKAMLVRP
jgi:hypothetical protein